MKEEGNNGVIKSKNKIADMKEKKSTKNKRKRKTQKK